MTLSCLCFRLLAAIYKYYIGDKNVSLMSEKNLTLLLDLSGSASQCAERWHKRKCAFEYYAAGKGISNICKKMPQLLHFYTDGCTRHL